MLFFLKASIIVIPVCSLELSLFLSQNFLPYTGLVDLAFCKILQNFVSLWLTLFAFQKNGSVVEIQIAFQFPRDAK